MHRITAFLAAFGLLAFAARPFLGTAPPAARERAGERSPFTWEEPAAIAAFIDPRDPAVLAFVRAAWASLPVPGPGEFPPPQVSAAATLLSCLAARGLRHLPDPPAPPGARPGTDQVSRPWETFLSRAGDCEDLAVLACSMLEAASVPSALAIADHHVFFLIDAGIAAAELPASPFAADTVICRGGRVWLPVEVSALASPGASFTAAWRAAWSRCGPAASRLTVIEIERAWQRWPPAGSPLDSAVLAGIAMSVAPCAAEAAAREIATLEEYFAANVASRLDREPPPGDRALAAAFARAGLLGPARRALEHSLDEIPDGDPGRAALLSDLGLVLALGARSRDDLDRARARLDAALAALPRRAHRESGDVLARLALVHRRRGDLELERASLREAAALDPAAAARYLAPGESPVGAGGTSNEE